VTPEPTIATAVMIYGAALPVNTVYGISTAVFMKSAVCTVIVAPAKASIKKVSAPGSGKAKISWSKVSGASGYQIQVKKAGGKYKTAASVTKGSTVSKTISKLKAGKKYSVRVRAYKKIDSAKTYGAWSAVKTVKIK
jgi:Fibronectin type III domain.